METITSAIGIDVGSSKCVLAGIKNKNVDTILNESAHRSTPTVVAFGEGERLVGDAAANQIKSNFKNTVQFIGRFLGLSSDTPQLEEEKKYIQNTIVEMPNKRIAFEVRHRGETLRLFPEQIYAAVLQRMKSYYNREGINTRDVVISVPSYLTAVERQAVLDSAKIAELNCVKLINESTAIALAYGLFRKADFATVERKVCFVDLGHGKLTVSIASFLGNKAKILGHASDRNLGARSFDLMLMDRLCEDFKKKFGSDPRKVPKCRLRLLDAIEKQRKVLSANTEAHISVESLLEDEDLSAVIHRPDFEKSLEPILGRIQEVFRKLLEITKLTPEQLHSIEMIGEATRIPIIQECTRAFFGVESVSRTLNSAECIARGCTIQAAILSPLFKVTDLEIEEWNPFDLAVGWSLSQADAQGNNMKYKTLFAQGSNYPSLKSLTFDKRREPMNVEVRYANPAQLQIEGVPHSLGHFKIDAPPAKEEKFELVVKVRLDIHGMCYLNNAELNEEYMEEKKVPVKDMPAAPTPAQPKADQATGEPAKMEDVKEDAKKSGPEQPEIRYETKLVKKTRKTDLHASGDTLGFTRNEILNLISFESKAAIEDHKITETKNKKNELESYVYDMRAHLDAYGTFKPHVQENIRVDYLAKLNAIEEWLYGEGKLTTKDVYQSKLQEIQAIGDPIKKRHHSYSELSVLISQYMQAVDNVKGFFVDLSKGGDQQFRADKVAELKALYESNQAWLNDVIEKQKTKQLYEDPVVDITTLHDKMEQFMKSANHIANEAKTPLKEEQNLSDSSPDNKDKDGDVKME